VTTKFDCCLAELCKVAEPAAQPPEKKKNRHIEAIKVIGSGVAGLGAGQLAGYGAGKLLERVTGKKGGDAANMARKIAPIVGGAAGIIYPIWQGQQQKAVRDAVESADNQSDRRVPGQ